MLRVFKTIKVHCEGHGGIGKGRQLV